MDDWKYIISTLVVGAILLVGILALGKWIDSVSCNARYQDFEHKYEFISGCMVKEKGKWIPDDKFRVVEGD